MRTIYNNHFSRVCVAPVARTDGTLQGTAVDRTDPTGGVNANTNAMFIIHAGVITDGTHTVTVEESVNNSDWTEVAAGHLLGSAPVIAGADDNKTFDIGYIGKQRYIRLKVVSADCTTGGVFGAVCILGGLGSVR